VSDSSGWGFGPNFLVKFGEFLIRSMRVDLGLELHGGEVTIGF